MWSEMAIASLLPGTTPSADIITIDPNEDHIQIDMATQVAKAASHCNAISPRSRLECERFKMDVTVKAIGVAMLMSTKAVMTTG